VQVNNHDKDTNVVGEIKTKETRKKGTIVGLYGVAICCKVAMEKHRLHTVIGLQAVGKINTIQRKYIYSFLFWKKLK
jgi:hypothetical protein